MLYTYENCQHGADVHVVESRETLKHVASVDIAVGVVRQFIFPLTVGPDGEVASVLRHFRSIHPIGRDRYGRPCLFHCYGEVGQLEAVH